MANLAEIWRHPIKSHGRELLSQVLLSEGKDMPWDRRWAVAHEAAGLDEGDPGWQPCARFSRGSKAPQLQAITAEVDWKDATVTLRHPKLRPLTIDPDNSADALDLIQWVMPLVPKDRPLPARIVRTRGRAMTDTDYPSISIINAASHRAVAAELARDISPLRWRGNMIVEGFDAWAEQDWVGRRLRVGEAELEIKEPIMRCLATAASVRSGQRDADTLGILTRIVGEPLMGVYAVVTRSGEIRQGDPVELT